VSGLDTGGVVFLVYPQDHEPRHVHGFVGSPTGPEVIVALLPDGTVDLADRKDAVNGANRTEIKKVLRSAQLHFDRLVQLWDRMHNGTH